MKRYWKYLLILKVIPKLGFKNVAYVFWYRLTLKTGFRKLFFKIGSGYQIEDFEYEVRDRAPNTESLIKLEKEYEDLKQGIFTYFSCHKHKISSPPNWFFDPFNNYQYQETDKHWCDINEFASHDIKILWEPSRFQWLVILARYFKESRDTQVLKTARAWLQDWVNKNPLNIGPQWKCGQECSLRVLHLILALRVVSKKNILTPKDDIAKFIYEHAIRISKNIQYARSQDNNHGTSEGLGLFIAGCILENSNIDEYRTAAKSLKRKGRKTLEERVNKLVLADGSFSQRSTNYHRVLLDTLSMAEFFRKEFSEPNFSEQFYQRGKSAIIWLHNFIANENTGEVPNFGHNDGAKLLSLTSAPYNDYRESVNICSYFMNNFFLYETEHNLEFLSALELENVTVNKIEKKSKHFKDGGYIILRSKEVFCFLNAPIYKFRPLQEDLFHIDLWVNGENVLSDSGTYSYNNSKLLNNLKSYHAHNSPYNEELSLKPIGKFLFAEWPNAKVTLLDDLNAEATAHINEVKVSRRISLSKDSLEIFDNISKGKTLRIYFNSQNKDFLDRAEQLEEGKASIIESEISKHYLKKEKSWRLSFQVDKSYAKTRVSF